MFLFQVWLATLLSLVVVTLTFALLTQPGWSRDPKFGFIDSKNKSHRLILVTWFSRMKKTLDSWTLFQVTVLGSWCMCWKKPLSSVHTGDPDRAVSAPFVLQFLVLDSWSYSSWLLLHVLKETPFQHSHWARWSGSLSTVCPDSKVQIFASSLPSGSPAYSPLWWDQF